MQDMPPGLVIDLFIYRRNYDEPMHGIQRGEEKWPVA
jgi:hypothetical protein